MIAALLIALHPALAADGDTKEPKDTSLEAQANRKMTAGGLELGLGCAAVVGGLSVMLLGRGEPGAISDEEPFEQEARTLSGGVLVVAGLTSVLVGANQISKARSLRERASVSATVLPFATEHGGGLAFDARF